MPILVPGFLQIKTADTILKSIIVEFAANIVGQASRRETNISLQQNVNVGSQGQIFVDIMIRMLMRNGFSQEDSLENFISPDGTSQFIVTFNQPNVNGGAVNYSGNVKVYNEIFYTNHNESIGVGNPLSLDYHFTATQGVWAT